MNTWKTKYPNVKYITEDIKDQLSSLKGLSLVWCITASDMNIRSMTNIWLAAAASIRVKPVLIVDTDSINS